MPLRDALHRVLAERHRGGGGRSRLRPLQRRRLRRAGEGHVRRDGGDAAHGAHERRSARTRHRARLTGRQRRRDAHRHRRHAAARRRRGTDGRAFGAGRIRSGQRLEIRRPLTAGENVSYAGTDIARGETVLRAGQLLTSREIGVLAALGLAEIGVYRRPRVAIFSTGNEIVAPGEPLRTGAVYDSNAAIIGAAVEELGGTPVHLGVIPDDEAALAAALTQGLAIRRRRVLGRHVQGRGRPFVPRWCTGSRNPGVVAHGVALKPGKPICLAVTDGKPVVILPGFPTSAIFTFHEFVAPVIRAYAGLPVERRQTVAATLPMRVNSERGRTEYLLVGLVQGPQGLIGLSDGQGLGLRHDVQRRRRLHHHRPAHRDPGSRQRGLGAVAGAAARARRPGRHRQSLRRSRPAARQADAPGHAGQGALRRQHGRPRRGQARRMRHRRRPPDGSRDRRVQPPAARRIACRWCRAMAACRASSIAAAMRGSKGKRPDEAIAAALREPDCVMVNRNAGSGTRIIIDKLLGEHRPAGYGTQTKSHNAVAAAVSQGRADWGVAIDTVAQAIRPGIHPAAGRAIRFHRAGVAHRASGGARFPRVAGRPRRCAANWSRWDFEYNATSFQAAARTKAPRCGT